MFNHDDLMKEIDKRFDETNTRLERLEDKLDKYTVQTAEIKQDISWIKGSTKVGFTAIATIASGIIKLFIDKT